MTKNRPVCEKDDVSHVYNYVFHKTDNIDRDGVKGILGEVDRDVNIQKVL